MDILRLLVLIQPEEAKNGAAAAPDVSVTTVENST
jgi:hypothetical protein